MRAQGGAEGQVARRKRSACGEGVVNNQYMLEAFREVADAEDAADVGKAGGGVQAGLGAGAPAPDKCLGQQRGPKFTSNGGGNYFCLVVAPAAPSEPVKRHGNHGVNVPELPRSGHISAQKGGEKSARRYVVMVFYRLGDFLVRVFTMIEKEGRGV